MIDWRRGRRRTSRAFARVDGSRPITGCQEFSAGFIVYPPFIVRGGPPNSPTDPVGERGELRVGNKFLFHWNNNTARWDRMPWKEWVV